MLGGSTAWGSARAFAALLAAAAASLPNEARAEPRGENRPAAEAAPSTDAPDVVVETAPPEAPESHGAGTGARAEQRAPREATPGGDFVLVHLDSSLPVQLEYRPDDATPFDSMCTSPCVRFVPASGTYRIEPVAPDPSTPPREREALARRSGAFVLAAGKPRQTIVVRAASQSAFHLGLGLTIAGGAVIGVGALWIFVSAYESDGDAPNLLIPELAIAGGAIGVGLGVFLLATNFRTTVTVDGAPAQAPRPRDAEARALDTKWRLDERDQALRPPMRGAVLPLLRVDF